MSNFVAEDKALPDGAGSEWFSPYELLRRKWGTVPYDAQNRMASRDLLQLGDRELLAAWDHAYHGTSTASNFGIRGWYHDLYRGALSGRKVLDLGCGMAVSSIHFAEHGARIVFADIVEDNIRVVERLCALKGISGEFLYIEDQDSFAQLPYDFDVVLAIGSLINAPREVVREEIQALLPHVKRGGRWLHLGYPKARWEREGMPPLSEWGAMTDGPGTPWMEYHDWAKLVSLFSPTPIELVFDCEWHNHDFNWFDFRVDPDAGVPTEEALNYPSVEEPDRRPTPVTVRSNASRFSVFLEPEARRINEARQQHLGSLGLDLDGKRVLEVGAGIGLHTEFFERRGCDVVSTDANPFNVAEMLRLYPHRRIGVLDLDRPAAFGELGMFDIVYCYGALYHLRDPDGALARLAAVCTGQILIETVVSRGDFSEVHHVVEPLSANQGIQGIGTRPTRPWVMSALRRHFGHAYTTLDQPDFPDFVTDWRTIAHGGNLRAVFVGSKCALGLPSLTASLPERHRNASALPEVTPPRRVWIDVGAYHGDASRQAALDDPLLVVHAFEPVPALHDVLAGAPDNYVVHAMAVSDHDGMAPFRINSFTAASSLLPLDEAARRAWIDGELLIEEREIVVPTTRLDTFMNEAGIAAVEFLKVDAQGADFAVIQSAGDRLGDIRRIKLEVATTPRQLYRGAADKATIVAFLESRGFALTETEPQSHGQEENLTFVPLLAGADHRHALSCSAHPPGKLGQNMIEIAQIPLSQIAPLGSGRITHHSGAAILVTEPGQWHHSAEAVFDLLGIDSGARVVTVSAEVASGRVGIGWLSADGSDWIIRTLLARTGAPADVALTVPGGVAGGRLIIANATEDGQPAVAIIGRICVSLTEHHPIFREPAFAAGYHGPFSPDLWVDFIGSASKRSWTSTAPGAPGGVQESVGMPTLDEEYFEWCALLQSVRDARDRYVMVELGAGFGRWGIRAAVAARRRGIPDIRVKLVEAEPQHAQWARENIALNGLGGIVTVTEAAISYSGQRVPFTIDYEPQGLSASSWYGQAIVDWEASLPDPTGETYFGHPVHRSPNRYGQILVPSLPLEAVLDDFDRIDMVDADIQGAEGEMILRSIETLTAKVARIYLGTHSAEIEDNIRTEFNRAGWVNEWDFALQGERNTPYGRTTFGDGVQSWINPFLR